MEESAPAFHLFGIRHHGPGCARMLAAELEQLRPDCLLIEGPPDAEGVLAFAAEETMRPPVALLVHARENPSSAGFYPFAEFSPEWQAIRYGLAAGIPVRFMDLPQEFQLKGKPDEQEVSASEDQAEDPAEVPAGPEEEPPEDELLLHCDPLAWLAEAAGYDDGEEWWERMVEERQDGEGVFPAIREAMTVLRDNLPDRHDADGRLREERREAWMRRTMRQARKEGFERIAVVCGAWHVPALIDFPPAKHDNDLLKGLSKVPVEATWVPWTYSRLSSSSGYGAGVRSPGYYEHLWRSARNGNQPPPETWMVRVARLLRDEDIDCSSAHVIEAVRLANTLAAYRDRSTPGLTELNEAVLTVICMGDDTPLRLIQEKLIVGESLGEVPESAPAVPLARDLAKQQKSLRLKAAPVEKVLDLDLRKPNDLSRSHLLHRLELLDVPWGTPAKQASGAKGTFHEVWQLRWRPEFAVSIVEASTWGNTVENAAAARVVDQAIRTDSLGKVASLAEKVLLSNLSGAVEGVVDRLEELAATSGATEQLMDAVPPLANVARYGSVRQMDAGQLIRVLDEMVERICIGLPGACSALDDEPAEQMHRRIVAMHQAVKLLENDEHTAVWQRALRHLADMDGLHGLIAGGAARRLLDDRVEDEDTALARVSFALSSGAEAPDAAAWLQGFLHGSGLILLHDDRLWAALDQWLAGLPEDAFTRILPLVRRTFSDFPSGERRQLGERAKQPGAARTPASGAPQPLTWNEERAGRLLPVLKLILGQK